MSIRASGDLGLLFLPNAAPEGRKLRMPLKPADVFLDQVDPRAAGTCSHGVLGETEREGILRSFPSFLASVCLCR